MDDSKVIVTFRLPPSILEHLQRLSVEKQLPYGTFIRRLIMRELGELPPDCSLWQRETNPSQYMFAINNS